MLSLLSEYAGADGLLCVIDDAQWLDQDSAEALLIAARRLDTEGVALLLAARTPGIPLALIELPKTLGTAGPGELP